MTKSYLRQLNTIKQKINQASIKVINDKKSAYTYGAKGGIKDDVFNRLSEFTTRGKGLRGTLFYYLAIELGCKNKKDIIDFAVGLELIHSALLIHDDIMDNDLLRRGKPSMHAQYIAEVDVSSKNLALETAKSIAISVGDLAIFLAFELFSKSLSKHPQNSVIMSRLVKDYSLTGLGQIDDVFFSAAKIEPTPEEISRVFLHKTARYTFSLPLSMAALFSGQPTVLVKNLDKIGEHMGIVFQMRDDEIGFYGESAAIGKTVGLDIIRNNKTLIRYFLYQNSSRLEKSKLDKIFGNPRIKQQDIEHLKNLALTNGATQQVERLKEEHISFAMSKINKIKTQNIKNSLLELLTYLNHRNS